MTLGHLLHLRPVSAPPAPTPLPPVTDDLFVYVQRDPGGAKVHRIVAGQCPPLPHRAPFHEFDLMRVGEIFARRMAPRWCAECWPDVALCVCCRRPTDGSDDHCGPCGALLMDADKRIERAA